MQRVIAAVTTDFIKEGTDYPVVIETETQYEIIDDLYLNGFYDKKLFNPAGLSHKINKDGMD